MNYQWPIKVFEFFSGCGGASRGFKEAGMEIVFALDSDKDSENTFRANFPETHFERTDINNFTVESLQPFVEACKGHPLLFSGCAPCQPFTKQKTVHPKIDERVSLLQEFSRFVSFFEPEFVFVENVPGIQKLQVDSPIGEFIEALEGMEYKFEVQPIFSQSYGVPQRRRRLVLIASSLGVITMPDKTHGPGTSNAEYSKVSDWIADLPPIKAGETHPYVPNHRAAGLSELNLMRIKATPQKGSRLDWPDELKLDCHTNGYDGHTDVYGRMDWNSPATGLTTRCISLSNGRFGHPDQDRAISVREAACLQTFPRDFFFHGNLNSMARQIGNAVPVLLAQRFGENFINHLHYLSKDQNNGKV